jgi:hypothetical protein
MPSYIDRENYCENICHCNHLRCDKKQCSIWKAPEVEMIAKTKEEGKDNE